MLDFLQHWASALAADHVVPLVIHAQQIETGALVFDYAALRSQQAHAFFLEETLRFVFNPGIDLVVAVASPDAERSAQAAQFGDAGFQGIAFAADEVSGDECDVGMEIVGHVDGTRDFRGWHVVADVDVAELRDAQTVKFRRKIGDGYIHALDGVTETARGESVGRGQKWNTAGENGGVLEEGAARGIEVSGDGSGTKVSGD